MEEKDGITHKSFFYNWDKYFLLFDFCSNKCSIMIFVFSFLTYKN